MALCLTAVFRAFAAFSPTFNEAIRYCGVALNIFVLCVLPLVLSVDRVKPAQIWRLLHSGPLDPTMAPLDPLLRRPRLSSLRGAGSVYTGPELALSTVQALLANEFKGLKLACSPADIVPRGATYNDTRYQTCAFAGSTPGSLIVDGEAEL